jgi:hypothetical protein
VADDRFTIRWDADFGGYRVSVPELEEAEVVRAERHDEVQRELAALRGAGDQMQSALSRLTAWLKASQMNMPYEEAMAAREGENACEAWTEVRRGSVVDA